MGPLIGRYCGTRVPPEIHSSTGILSLSFHTDMAVAKDGFSARYNMTHKEVSESKSHSLLFLFYFFFTLNFWSKSLLISQYFTAATRSVWSQGRSRTTRSRPRRASTTTAGCRGRPDSTTTTTPGRPTKTATGSTYR